MRRWVKRSLGAWLAWKLLGPELTPRFRPGQRHPLRMAGRSIFVGDTEFFVREVGSPHLPTLVLVHGWGDHSLVVYAKLIPLLQDHFHIVAVDNRNAGKSDHIRGRFDIATMADDLAAILDQLGLGRVSVFGYSMGGMVCQELAYRHPNLVDRLMLGGTAAYVGSPSGVARPVVQFFYLVARAFERVTRAEWSAIRTKYLERVGAITPEYTRWFWAQSISRDPEVYWQSGFAIARFDSREWVGRLPHPALVIITCVDQLMFPRAQYDLAGRLRHVTTVELHDGRHEAPLTHPERFSRAIIEFAATAGSPIASGGGGEPAGA